MNIIDKNKAKRLTEKIIFDSIIGLCEEIEKSGYRGSGSNLARTIATIVTEGLLPKQQKEIYDLLTSTPTSTIEIAKKCGLSSKLVSAQLKQISDHTHLIASNNNSGKKLWFRIG